MSGKLEIKYIEADVDTLLEDFAPPKEGYMLAIEMGIGEEGKRGSDIFTFNICDEKGLKRYVIENDAEFKAHELMSFYGYNLMVLKTFNYDSLLIYINGILKKIPENLLWKQKGMLLNRHFSWEYESETIDGLQ